MDLPVICIIAELHLPCLLVGGTGAGGGGSSALHHFWVVMLCVEPYFVLTNSTVSQLNIDPPNKYLLFCGGLMCYDLLVNHRIDAI